MVREHLLSILRLSYSSEAALFPRPVWHFVDIGQCPSMKLQFDLTYGPIVFDAEATRNLFAASFDHREEVRLILDGSDTRLRCNTDFYHLPVLEMFFRSGKEWILFS